MRGDDSMTIEGGVAWVADWWVGLGARERVRRFGGLWGLRDEVGATMKKEWQVCEDCENSVRLKLDAFVGSQVSQGDEKRQTFGKRVS